MKKMLKITVALLIVASVLVSAVCVFASDELILAGEYTVDGNKLTLKVSVSNNPGLNAILVKFGYDSAVLTLESATNGDVFSNANNGKLSSKNVTLNPARMFFEQNDISNNQAVGTLFTAVFTINNTDIKDYGLTLEVDSSSTYKNVNVTPVSVEAKTYIDNGDLVPGDINGDGKVNALDALDVKCAILGVNCTDQMKRYADINKDGKLNAMDAIDLIKIILALPE